MEYSVIRVIRSSSVACLQVCWSNGDKFFNCERTEMTCGRMFVVLLPLRKKLLKSLNQIIRLKLRTLHPIPTNYSLQKSFKIWLWSCKIFFKILLTSAQQIIRKDLLDLQPRGKGGHLSSVASDRSRSVPLPATATIINPSSLSPSRLFHSDSEGQSSV